MEVRKLIKVDEKADMEFWELSDMWRYGLD